LSVQQGAGESAGDLGRLFQDSAAVLIGFEGLTVGDVDRGELACPLGIQGSGGFFLPIGYA
jgi:hypothetical protein